MTRRVRIGAQRDGSSGLLVSAPGVDVETCDPMDGNQTTFNSNWTDFLKVHQVGSGHITARTGTGEVLFPALPYKPFVEARAVVGNRVFDDTFSGSRVGIGVNIRTDRLIMATDATYDYVYVVYKVGIPVT